MSEAEAPLEELLRRRARAAVQGTHGACGDAESLAAYAEGNLLAAEREQFEAHLAGCAQCQAAVVRLVRLAPQQSAAARPGTAVAPSPAGAIKWRWALPGLATALLIGSVVYYERGRVTEPPAPVATSEAPAPPAPAPQLDNAQQRRDREGERPPTAKQAEPRAKAKDVAPEFSPVPAGQPAEKPAELARTENALAASQAANASVSPPPAPAIATSNFAQQAMADTVAQTPAIQFRAQAMQEPEPVKSAGVGGTLEATKKRDFRLPSVRPAINSSKAVLTGFRKVVNAGTHSFALNHMGQLFEQAMLGTWHGVQVPMARALADFSIVNQHLWALLPDGHVVHSRDLGETWDPPVDTGAEDATSIAFTSPTSGEIATLSGTHLYTSDGGRTWKTE